MPSLVELRDALLEAYARGYRRLAYDGRVTEYPDGKDMLQRIRELDQLIAAQSNPNARPLAGYAAYRRSAR